SGRNFAASFLQIPPRNGHPCSWLMVGYTTYPHNGLAPSSYSPCTAHNRNPLRHCRSGFFCDYLYRSGLIEL
ncbi:MAG: hypothetical protein NTY07_21140, partial [Bacteroidia bacterium]|nr:hypothetical protein [Bacteroidia bacterium]